MADSYQIGRAETVLRPDGELDINARDDLRTTGAVFRVVNAHGAVARVLNVSGAQELFDS